MPTQIYNTASLTFEYGSQKGFVSSNVAVTTLKESLTISHSSLGDTYSQGSEIPFIVSIINNNTDKIKNVKIQSDLGTYSLGQGICENSFTPLSYTGPSMLYVGGVFLSNIEPKVYKEKLVFTVASIPPKSNALIIYKASINQFSPLSSGSKIVNTVTASSRSITSPLTSSNTITVRDEADIRIIKNMSPNPVLAGETITYNFSLYNYGNTEARNVTLNDTFTPAPGNINVYLDSQEISSTDFSYSSGTLTLPTYNSGISVSIPAANFIQDTITGSISIEPGMISITATGQI